MSSSPSSTAPARSAVLLLYRRLLRAGAAFQDYNIRETARRKIREKVNFSHQHTTAQHCTALPSTNPILPRPPSPLPPPSHALHS